MFSKDIDKFQSIKINENMNGVEMYDRDFCDFIQKCTQKHLTSLFKTISEFKKVNPNKGVLYAYVDDKESRVECSYDESIVRHLISDDIIQYGFYSMIDDVFYWFSDYEDMHYEQKEMFEEWQDLQELIELEEDENTKD